VQFCVTFFTFALLLIHILGSSPVCWQESHNYSHASSKELCLSKECTSQ